MIYCTKCVYPESKPDLFFKDGICSACLNFEVRKSINWKEREQSFKELFSHLKKQNNSYDCIIPVSGGKDSHYQVIKALEYGLRPLCVNATTDDLSVLGRYNLDNITKLGVDLLEVNTNKKVRKKISKYALETVGDISWAEHATIFTVPFRIAKQLNIPFIIYGENPQNEYGGPDDKISENYFFDENWLQEFGGLNGLRITDLVEKNICTKEELFWYSYPPRNHKINDDLTTKAVYLGYYFDWDGYNNALLAKKHGFKWNTKNVEGVGYKYENLDNYQTGIHDLFKYLKFGFGRATDLVCNHIRRGRITRESGIRHIKKYDGEYFTKRNGNTYLDKKFENILLNIDISLPEFDILCKQFTNKNLFKITLDPTRPKSLFKIGEI